MEYYTFSDKSRLELRYGSRFCGISAKTLFFKPKTNIMAISGSKIIDSKGETVGYCNTRIENMNFIIETYGIDFKNCDLVNFKIVFIRETFREKLKRYFKIIKSKL